MTALLEKSVRLGGAKPAATVVHGLPQVNLLPPEVRAARSLAVVKRWLGIGLIAVLVVIGLGYAVAAAIRSGAGDELTSAQSETTRLQKQERKYAEVPQVQAQVSAAQQARTAGMADEILWKPYLDAITAVLPAGVSIDAFTLTGPSPLEDPKSAASPLDGPSIGTISFQGRSLAVPDTAAWMDALASVPGFSDPWVSSASLMQEDQKSSPYYQVSSTINLTSTTLANRFVEKASDKGSK